MKTKTSGFTLIELVFTLAIISVLASITWVSMAGFRQRADAVGCIQHMKSIGIALNAYTMDKGYWPQVDPSGHAEESHTWEAWYKTLEPYQIHEGTWLCPTHERQLRGSKGYNEEEDDYVSSYAPAQFDKDDSAPFIYGDPWVIERADFHLRGNHILMSDGSIQTFRSNIFR